MNDRPLACEVGRHPLIELAYDTTDCACGERRLPGMHTVHYQVAHYKPGEYTPCGWTAHLMDNTHCECHPEGIAP